MSSIFITVPEPLRFYMRDARTSSAIDDLLAKTKAPDDLTWEEFAHLVKARLTAQTVQAHYALFLHDLWRTTWGTVLMEEKISLNKWRDAWKDVGVEEAWSGGHFEVQAVIERKPFNFGAWLERTDSEGVFDALVAFYIDDGEFELSNRLKLPAPWDPEPDDGCRVTEEGLVNVTAETATIDVAPLLAAARQGYAVLRRGLRSFA